VTVGARTVTAYNEESVARSCADTGCVPLWPGDGREDAGAAADVLSLPLFAARGPRGRY